jgi:hypothetical protein
MFDKNSIQAFNLASLLAERLAMKLAFQLALLVFFFASTPSKSNPSIPKNPTAQTSAISKHAGDILETPAVAQKIFTAGPVTIKSNTTLDSSLRAIGGTFDYHGLEKYTGGACLVVEKNVSTCNTKAGCSAETGESAYCIQKRCWVKLNDNYCNKPVALEPPKTPNIPVPKGGSIVPKAGLENKPWRVHACLNLVDKVPDPRNPGLYVKPCMIESQTHAIYADGPIFQDYEFSIPAKPTYPNLPKLPILKTDNQ